MGPKTTESVKDLDELAKKLDVDQEGIRATYDSSRWSRKSISLGDAFQLGLFFGTIFSTDANEENVDQIAASASDISDLLGSVDFESTTTNQINSIRSELESEVETNSKDIDRVMELKRAMEAYSQILVKELGNEKRIAISSRGLFDVEKAMESPSDLFEREVWEWLPELPRNDISEACRCLAIESPTAATFLSLRAVEDCLRIWYQHESGGKVDETAWGGILRKLKQEFGDGNSKPPVLTNLDYLRMKRNEVNHPDKSPSWSEAEATLYIVRNTITEIYEEVDSHSDDDSEE
jgi:hypothetical protein